jgi:hypothetical protein
MTFRHLRRAAVSDRRNALRGRFHLTAGQVRNLAVTLSLLARLRIRDGESPNGVVPQAPEQARNGRPANGAMFFRPAEYGPRSEMLPPLTQKQLYIPRPPSRYRCAAAVEFVAGVVSGSLR